MEDLLLTRNMCLQFLNMSLKDMSKCHDVEHAQKVLNNSWIIFYRTNDMNEQENIKKLKHIIIVALLHDAFDHKFDQDGNMKKATINFLKSVLKIRKDTIEWYINIIERISFSKENKAMLEGTDENWLDVLGSEGLVIRDIVSDADKLEAFDLGRCILYSRHAYYEKYGEKIHDGQLIENVVKHCEEKLFRLVDFMRTDVGKEIATKLHDKLVKEVEKLDELIYVYI